MKTRQGNICYNAYSNLYIVFNMFTYRVYHIRADVVEIKAITQHIHYVIKFPDF